VSAIVVIQIITINFNYMRNIVNISLPDSMVKTIKKDTKNGGFASTSEFIRHLIRLWNTQQLGNELKNDKKLFEAGEGLELKSLKDLR
jgi:Arc/MetJ-type ribon-helix-helix transcriptional regulator